MPPQPIEQAIHDYVRSLCTRARLASRELARTAPERKDRALRRIADSIRNQADAILEANRKDVEAAGKKGLAPSFLDRLRLTDDGIAKLADAVEDVAQQKDPVGEVVSQWRRPGGFEVAQVRIPLGVIGIIYESRPNVTVDAAVLCFKAGNACILRGGSEAMASNLRLTETIRGALSAEGLNPDSVQSLETADRAAVGQLLRQNDLVDLIIPRGGKELIRRVVEESTIPVIKHYEGICHIYVHSEADPAVALRVAVNAKAQRPGTCNAMETLLVDRFVAPTFLPLIAAEFSRLGVRILGCPLTASIIPVDRVAEDRDYRTEHLSLICNIRVVNGFDEAVEHIETFGSRHTDAIITRNYDAARRFVAEIDSSSVLVNASTRLADGGVYGLGAEIGISTDKLHAFGPMGVQDLTTRKFVVFGNGSIRE